MLLMGRRWLIVSLQPRSRGLGSSWTWNPCPTACPRQDNPSDTHVQHSQYLPSSAAHPKCAGVQQTGISGAKRRQTSCLWCAPCKGLCPTPISQSNCKTKPWTPWESGAKPTVHWLGTKSKPQTPPPCWTFLLQHPSRHRTVPSSGTCQAVLGAVLQFLLHPTQSCSISAARRDSRSHLLRGQTHRRLFCEGSSEFHGLAVLNHESVN